MKLKFGRIIQELSWIGMLLLFPGFYIYNFLISNGYMSPIFGSYFPLFSILLLLLYLLTYVLKIEKAKFCVLELVFFAFIVCQLLYAFIYYINSMPSGYTLDMLIWSFSGALYMTVMYFISKGLVINAIKLRPIYFLFVVMCALSLINASNMTGFVLQQADDIQKFAATYQGLARSLIFVLFVLIAYLENYKHIYFVMLIGLAALFVNGARTEFVLALISIISLFILNSFFEVRKLVIVFILLFLLVFIYYMALELYPDSRVFGLLDYSSDGSVVSRNELSKYSLDLIEKSVLFGEYGGYTKIGGVGKYPHNILSVWVNLGLVGVVLYFSILSLLWLKLFKNIYKIKLHCVEYRLFTLFVVATTVAVLFAKDYTFPFLGVCVGIYAKLNALGANKFLVYAKSHKMV